MRFSTFLSMTSTDCPRAFSIDRQFQISSRISGARPSVASSRIRSFGLVISARPIASICCSPPESVTPMLPPRSASRGNSTWIFSSVQGSGFPRRLPEAATRFSRTVRFGKIWRPSGHQADAEFCNLVGGKIARLLPAEADRAGARRRQPHDGADGGGLAHAVAAHQRDHLARLDRQRHAEQHLAQAVAGLDAVDFKQRLRQPWRVTACCSPR